MCGGSCDTRNSVVSENVQRLYMKGNEALWTRLCCHVVILWQYSVVMFKSSGLLRQWP